MECAHGPEISDVLGPTEWRTRVRVRISGPLFNTAEEWVGTLHDIIMWVPFCETATCTFCSAKGSKITLMVYVYRAFSSPSSPFRSYGISRCAVLLFDLNAPEWHQLVPLICGSSIYLFLRISRFAQMYSSFQDTMNDLLGDTNIRKNNILNILSSVKKRNLRLFPNLSIDPFKLNFFFSLEL